MKTAVYIFKYHWHLSTMDRLIIIQRWSIIWNKDALVYWRIYASFGIMHCIWLSVGTETTALLLTWPQADVWPCPWWRHQMQPFSAYWPFVRGIHRSPVNSPHKGQWRRSLMFSLICAWTNAWVSNRDAGDLRRHRAHYGVTVLSKVFFSCWDPFTHCGPVTLYGATYFGNHCFRYYFGFVTHILASLVSGNSLVMV